MSFAEYFSAISTESALSEELIPGLLKYYREPTMSRAKTLLTTLGVPIPYEELNLFMKSFRRSASALASSLASASASRGGRRRHRKGAPKVVAPAPDFFAIHRCIDMIHDLSQLNSLVYLLPSLFSEVPGGGMPTEISERIQKIVATVPMRGLNGALVSLAESLGNLAPGGKAVQIDLNPRKDAVLLRADIRFANQVAEWLKRPTLELVLDNVFTEPIPSPKKLAGAANALGALNNPASLRTLALCAFLQLVIGTWDASLVLPDSGRPTAVPPSAVSEVKFLIGTFQTMDIGGYKPFLTRWVKRLRMESAHFYGLSAANFTYAEVSVADAAAASAIDPAVLRSTGIHSHGLFVPYRMPYLPSSAHTVEAVLTGRAFLEKFRDHFYTSYNKEWLRQVYTAYYMLSKSDRAQSDVAAFMSALFEINALRDSLRADVALSRGAVFITGDYLALVYYSKRAEQLGKPIAGLGINVEGAGDMNARIYPDPASERHVKFAAAITATAKSASASQPRPPAT